MGFIIWAAQRQSSDMAERDRAKAALESDGIRRRMFEDEERIRLLIAGELAKFQIAFGVYLNGTYPRTTEVNARFTAIEASLRSVSDFLSSADPGGKGLRSIVRHEVNNAMQAKTVLAA